MLRPLLESWTHLIKDIMISVYNIEVDNEAICRNLKRIQSQIFKLLPMAEEKLDYKKPLETIILELLGMQKLFSDSDIDSLISLICKLKGLTELDLEQDFLLYRRTIFECCGLVDKVKVCF